MNRVEALKIAKQAYKEIIATLDKVEKELIVLASWDGFISVDGHYFRGIELIED